MKQLLTLFLCVAGTIALHSQTTTLPIICGNEVLSHVVKEKYPALDAAFKATFEEAKRKGHAALQERSPLTVQVVVHVVWKEEAENLTDEIIEDQIRILNEDFNRLNADTVDLREEFHFVAGKADIHFELAEIVRVETDAAFEIDVLGGDLASNLKSSADGGSDGWDPEHYLNIWVCKIQPTTIFGLEIGQILGFAFPPNGLDHWPEEASAPTPEQDGVVIDYRVFSSINPNTVDIPGGGGTLTVKGRTPVHEVAHYLGLRHIWGDGGTFGPNDCAQSDGVEDTPFASSQSNFDCDKTKNSCEQVELFYNEDPLDLVENFMDYSSEECMNMFTKGQVEIMRGVLTGPRAGLLNSVSTQQPTTGIDVRISPNPAQDRALLSFDLQQQSEVSVRMISADGRMVLEVPAQPFGSGRQQMALDTRQVPTGVYFVQLLTDGMHNTLKMSVEH